MKRKAPVRGNVAKRVWVGFANGGPYVDTDENYNVPRLHVFKTRKDAARCFQDVRKAYLVYERKRRP